MSVHQQVSIITDGEVLDKLKKYTFTQYQSIFHILIVMFLFSNGCARYHPWYHNGYRSMDYMLDRVRDALDMTTMEAGFGLGVKLRAGILNTGYYQGNGFFGLRGGKIGMQSDAEYLFLTPYPKTDLAGETIPSRICRNEYYSSKNVTPLTSIFPPNTIVDSKSHDYMENAPTSAYFQIEMAVGLGPTLRIGFNPAEILDFLLGFAGVDILSDDYGRHRDDFLTSRKVLNKDK
jgi:hypothetical protein